MNEGRTASTESRAIGPATRSALPPLKTGAAPSNARPTPADLGEEREMRSVLGRYGFDTGGRESDEAQAGGDLLIVDGDQTFAIPRLTEGQKDRLRRGDISFLEPKQRKLVPGPGSLEAGVLNAISSNISGIAALPLWIAVNSSANPPPELVNTLHSVQTAFRVELKDETDEKFAKGTENILLFGMALLNLGSLLKGGLAALARAGSRSAGLTGAGTVGAAAAAKVGGAFDPIFDLSLTPTKEALMTFRARAAARMQAIKNGSFSPRIPSWALTARSQAAWRNVRLDRLSTVESQLVTEVLNAPTVVIGRSTNIAGRGYYTLDNGVLIKGWKWTQRLQDVYNKALSVRTSAGLPVSVISGSAFTLGEVEAAEAGAALGGLKNIPYWPDGNEPPWMMPPSP